MELLLIADFHLYNLIFAKETLNLSNLKASVLMNILWILLKERNPSYQPKDSEEEEPDDLEAVLLAKDALLRSKTVEKDIKAFKTALINHSIENRPHQIKFFCPEEIQKIVEHVHNCYIDKYDLYKYIFVTKDQKEEVKISIDISTPEIPLPLKDALYMGFE